MNPAICSTSIAADCESSSCRQRCALEVIDELLREHEAISGEEADLLLDLRWHLRQGSDAEGTLRLFCDLRIRLEQRHYLAFFRLRRWLENHLVASVRLCPAAEPHLTPVKFDRYCVEAIRRVCLCAALGRGSVLLAPRVRFCFHDVTTQVADVKTSENLVAVESAV
ncbi:MAG: hypothetical protein ABJF10_06325 [Chthoniobacter sp.]|uniref:hypothetical protein n=1 Tax=Chthoniobacter sp. TaxID=2510640 RepID=UPI0032A8020D